TLLWPAHDITNLKEQWGRFGSEIQQKLGTVADPIDLYSELAGTEKRLRFNEQSLVHGDLHISNVALDNIETKPVAYIFDPGVISQNVAGRDLAVLEVSVMLHQRLSLETFEQSCSALYVTPSIADLETIADPVGKSAVAFIRALRQKAGT